MTYNFVVFLFLFVLRACKGLISNKNKSFLLTNIFEPTSQTHLLYQNKSNQAQQAENCRQLQQSAGNQITYYIKYSTLR